MENSVAEINNIVNQVILDNCLTNDQKDRLVADMTVTRYSLEYWTENFDNWGELITGGAIVHTRGFWSEARDTALMDGAGALFGGLQGALGSSAVHIVRRWLL